MHWKDIFTIYYTGVRYNIAKDEWISEPFDLRFGKKHP